MRLKAVFFDMDGVIIDTEKDGHRVAFNYAFKEFGIDAEWSVEDYHSLLQVGGGKERIKYYFEKTGFKHPELDSDPVGFIKKIHLRKTDLFIELIRSRKLPLRPGVRRLMEEINGNNILLAICTTSNEKSAHAVADSMLTGIKIDYILAGDIVKKKKPDPAIYNLAQKKSGIEKNKIIVVEDSNIGVQAAGNAGINVIATVNEYTKNEDVSSASLVVSCLGDTDGEKAKIFSGNVETAFNGIVTLEILDNLLGR